MKCPHCLTSIHPKEENHILGNDSTSLWAVVWQTCPACKKFIIALHEQYDRYRLSDGSDHYYKSRVLLAYPKAPSRTPLPPEVPSPYRDDYREACMTLADSPKASAALSRRCLQAILRDHAGVKHGNLAGEIQQVIDSGKLPSHLTESLDAIRNIGNFAAHPIKSTSTGEVIEVEDGEAEWNLDVLESLFDFYFVQPAIIKKKRDALNSKLKDAGKPQMK